MFIQPKVIKQVQNDPDRLEQVFFRKRQDLWNAPSRCGPLGIGKIRLFSANQPVPESRPMIESGGNTRKP